MIKDENIIRIFFFDVLVSRFTLSLSLILFSK